MRRWQASNISRGSSNPTVVSKRRAGAFLFTAVGPARAIKVSADAIGDHHVTQRRSWLHRTKRKARDERELRRARVVEHARLALVDEQDLAHAIARRGTPRALDVDFVVRR